ncbi:MAG: hypothetical protein Q9170_002377 [Blastenia crenularia]
MNRTPVDDHRRQTNLSQILEHSNGSPSRFPKTSPNLHNGNTPSARASKPAILGFGGISEGLQPNAPHFEVGPKSAPPQVVSFDQMANDEYPRSSNNELFDERWLQRPEEMYVTDARRTSIITISPDQNPPRPSKTSNPTSGYPSSTHLELLETQYGIRNVSGTGTNEQLCLGGQTHGQVRSGTSSPFPTGQSRQVTSAIFMGRGYDNLRAYVEMAADGHQRSVVPELEQLMSTLLYLRGDGDALPSMEHFGRDALRKFVYKCVFDSEDGSSKLSREQPSGLIDVAGRPIERQNLHQEIVHFLEDQLEHMTASQSQGDHNRLSQPNGAPSGGNRNHLTNGHNTYDHSYGRRQDQYHDHGTALFPTPADPINHEADLARSFQHLDPGGQQRGKHANHDSDPHEEWNALGLGEAPNVHNQQQLPPSFGFVPGVGQGPQGPMPDPYGSSTLGGHQQYMSMMPHHFHQHSGPFGPQQFMHSSGMAAGPMYLPHQAPPVTFYPGRQIMPSGGPVMPYGSPFFANPGFGVQQLGGPMAPPQFLPNPQMALSALPPHMSSWAPQTLRVMQPAGPQWSYSSNRANISTSRSGSPMLGGPQARAGRNVVSQIPPLPYRPGSDDMYPPKKGEGLSVRTQELIRHDGPSYALASKPENIPFVEAARQARPAEWGVLKIGNVSDTKKLLATGIPYSLTKQEVLGLLGRNAKIVTPDLGVPIHIIMDRTTGKTMDCYVEFFSYGDAQAAFNKCLLRGSQLRLADRVVDVSMSSQDALLYELFPKAKNVEWVNGRPVIQESNDPYNSGFKSFVTSEELLQLVSHAEKPHRFPWFAVDRYTMKTRDEIFRQTVNLITLLGNQLRRGHEAWIPHLSETLLLELLYAGLNAPAFGEYQRLQLRQAAGAAGDKIPMSPLVVYWPFEVLARKAGMEEDYVKKYAEFLRKHPQNTSTDEFNDFGTWTAESNEALGLTTVGQVGAHEMQMLLAMLRDVLP